MPVRSRSNRRQRAVQAALGRSARLAPLELIHFSQTLDLGKFAQDLLPLLRSSLRADFALILVVEKASGYARLCFTGLARRDSLRKAFETAELLALFRMSARRPVTVVDSAWLQKKLGERVPQARLPASALVGLIPTSRRSLGLVILGRRKRAFKAEDRAHLSGLLEPLRQPLDNVLLMEAYKELVIRDDQTESYNRRYFESFLDDEISRCVRYRNTLALIFMDVDNLKEVNTRYGHAMGSRALREVSRRVLSVVRRIDKLFRYGGDEFCIVLPQTSWQGAYEVAQRIRDAVSRMPFLVSDTGGRVLTATFGIASFPFHAGAKEELVNLADQAMYKMKGASKNSIQVAEAPKRSERAGEQSPI
ncbi:MAG: GGDEF domain-containing protein [Acidobacteriota bacterium]